MRVVGVAALAVAVLLVLGGCVPDTSHIKCDTDSNCPSKGSDNVTCGLEHVCVPYCKLSCAAGLTCAYHTGQAACECPFNDTGSYAVDPSVTPISGVAPTGVTTLQGCQFTSLAPALQAAGVWARGAGDGGASVLVSAASRFSAAASFPLDVPAGVLLASTDVQKPLVLLPDTLNLSGAALQLSPGSGLSGVSVDLGASGGGTGIQITCNDDADAGAAVLTSVTVQGRAARVGVDISSHCGVHGTKLTVLDAGVGLNLAVGSSAVFTNSTLSGGRAAQVEVGSLLDLEGLTLSGWGIYASSDGGANITLERLTIPALQDYLVDEGPGPSPYAMQLSVRQASLPDAGCLVHANNATVNFTDVSALYCLQPTNVSLAKSTLNFDGGSAGVRLVDGGFTSGAVSLLNKSNAWLQDVTLTGIQGSGLNVLGTTHVDLQGCVLSGSLTGAFVDGGTLTARGGTSFQGNVAGLVLLNSVANTAGTVAFQANYFGASVSRSTLVMRDDTQFADNYAQGLQVVNTDNDGGVDAVGTTFKANNEVRQLVAVYSSKQNGSGDPSLSFRGCHFTGGSGVFLGLDAGTGPAKVTAAFSDSLFSGSGLSDVTVYQSDDVTFTNNRFTLSSQAGLELFANVTATQNRFYANKSAQVLFHGPLTYDFGASACSSGNQLYCYGPSATGVDPNSKGAVMQNGGTAHLDFTVWQQGAPSSSTDLSPTSAFTYGFCPSLPAIASCVTPP